MKQIIKKLISLTIWLGIGISSLSVFAVNPPSYDQDFASHLTNDKSDIYVIKNDNIKTDKSLIENIKALFYPISSSETGDFIGGTIRVLAVGLIFVYLVYAGIQLLISGNKAEQLKDATRNLLYIAIGSIFIYGAGRFVGDVLNFSGMGGTQGLEGVSNALATGNGSIFFQLLAFLKGAAFFFAILMIVVTGFRVIAAADADKSKKLLKGLLNVIGALVIIKSVDFVYYIASQGDFATQATDFILKAAKFFGYLYGAAAVLMVFYAGYSFLTDGGSGNGMKRAKGILINLFVSGLVLFGFLLILYQVFAEFS